MASERLIQWEDRRREHLGGLIALILALSSGSIAFCGSLLTEESVKFGGWRTIVFLSAAACFVLALLPSLAVAFSRLQDARVTAHIVREDEKSMTAGYLARLRSKADFWGRLTWRLLYFQLGVFSLGVCLLLVALWLIFHSKLFPAC
jgi:MFS family permease